MSPLTGTWRLVSWSATADGVLVHPYGDDAEGILHYAASGQMYAFLNRKSWPRTLSGGATPDMFAAYSGRWRRSGNRLAHSVEFSSAPTAIGMTLERTIETLTKCELVLKAEIDLASHQLAWRREE
jgi:hypothetical protein